MSYFILAYARPNIDLPSLFKEANSAGTQVGVGDKLKTLSSAMFTYRGNAGDFARWAQFFLAVIFSLVFIYAIRELKQGKQIRARDALYGGTGNFGSVHDEYRVDCASANSIYDGFCHL